MNDGETIGTPIASGPEPQPPPKTPTPGKPPGTPDWWGNPDCPYDERTIQLWVDVINKSPWHKSGPDENPIWWKTLDCPRCTHVIKFDASGGVSPAGPIALDEGQNALLVAMSWINGVVRRLRRVVQTSTDPVRCNCAVTHEKDKKGCGQNGWINLP